MPTEAVTIKLPSDTVQSAFRVANISTCPEPPLVNFETYGEEGLVNALVKSPSTSSLMKVHPP